MAPRRYRATAARRVGAVALLAGAVLMLSAPALASGHGGDGRHSPGGHHSHGEHADPAPTATSAPEPVTKPTPTAKPSPDPEPTPKPHHHSHKPIHHPKHPPRHHGWWWDGHWRHGPKGEAVTVAFLDGSSITTDDSTPTISGSATSPSDSVAVTVVVMLNGTATDGTVYDDVTCSATVSADGSWECTISTGLHDGTFSLTATVTACSKGHSSSATATGSLTLATRAPAEPPAPPEDVDKPKPSSHEKPKSERPDPIQPVVNVADPEPQTITWSFRILDSSGADITDSALHGGDRISVVATALPAGATVVIELHSTPTTLGSASADADGTLALPVTIPSAAELGDHTIVGRLTAPGFATSEARMAVRLEALELHNELDAPPNPAPAIEPIRVHKPPVDADPDVRGFSDNHTGIADALPTIHDITAAPWKFAATGGLAAALVLLAALPAELLQSTLSENYGRAFGWLEPARRRIAAAQERRRRRFSLNPWASGAATVAVAALILGFANPSYGLNQESVLEFLALFLSLFVLNIVVSAIKLGVAWRELRLPGRLMPMPGALAVAAISVLVSRWMHLNPALLFGLVVSVHFAHIRTKRVAGKLALVAVSSVLALGIVAWVLFSVVVAATGHSESILVELTEETLAATALESLSVLLVALLPFQFLEGKHLHDWDKRVWAGMYLLAAGAFVFIAVPLGASWEESREPLQAWLSLLLGFTLISGAAWAAFRFIPSNETQREHAHSSH